MFYFMIQKTKIVNIILQVIFEDTSWSKDNKSNYGIYLKSCP